MRRRNPSFGYVSVIAGIFLFVCPLFVLAQGSEPGQEATPADSSSTEHPQAADDPPAPAVEPEQPIGLFKDDRLLYTLPNFLTVQGTAKEPPLTSGQKFKLVTKDCFDIAEYPFIGFQAAIAQSRNDPAGYGEGIPGYARRYGAAFADNTIGNYMTEAVFPSILHQDPRYYQLGHGNFFKRVGYTVSRSIITRGDSGHTQFNFSEIGGNAIAASISNLYYPAGNRTVQGTVEVWWTQIGWDITANLLREFWPDIHNALHHKKTN